MALGIHHDADQCPEPAQTNPAFLYASQPIIPEDQHRMVEHARYIIEVDTVLTNIALIF